MTVENILEGIAYQNKVIFLENLVRELSDEYKLNLDDLIETYILKKKEFIAKTKKKLLLIE